MGKLELADLEVELLSVSDALVFGAYIQTTRTASYTGVFTLHMKKIEGEWLIASDHSSSGA
jgi:hypothetical protein